MHVAIIIPAFNVAPFLATAIQSVLCQTHKDWVLIVVDDGSTDGSAAVVSGFSDPRIRIIRQANAGVSAARNTGLLACDQLERRPDAFLFLDGDDWLAPDALAALTATLAGSPDAVAAYGGYVRIGLAGAAKPVVQPVRQRMLDVLVTRNLFANGGHVLVRAGAVATAGGFRTDLSFGEDWEFWVRLALIGPFVAAPGHKPILYVRERPDSATMTRAADPGNYRAVLRAIYGNPDVAAALGCDNVPAFRRRAEAEIAWTVGRELIRHGQAQEGSVWLWRSIRLAPSTKRLMLSAMACMRLGPFQPYHLPKDGGIAAV